MQYVLIRPGLQRASFDETRDRLTMRKGLTLQAQYLHRSPPPAIARQIREGVEAQARLASAGRLNPRYPTGVTFHNPPKRAAPIIKRR